MRFGLAESAIERIGWVFARYPQVDTVLLYGSRAKGNPTNGSDIDLTVQGRDLSLLVLYKIERALDELNLPYSIDLSIYDHIDHDGLKEHIARVGVVFYERKSRARREPDKEPSGGSVPPIDR
jgi:predicted nucleotidyltransferase